MPSTVYRSCPLCEATCGLAIAIEGDRVVSVRGDADDPFSRGYVCPKAAALADLHDDPDRLQRPVVRDGTTWRELAWDEAFDLVARRLGEVRAAHGRDAIAVYQGNPTVHNLGLMTYGQLLFGALGTRNRYSATSLDQLPHMLAALQMFGSQLLMPVPDVDRCDLFVCLGANPLASNGSIMTAPDLRGRLAAIQRRGGRVIVLDPRRTETAERADRHLFVRPGSDAVLLLAMIDAVFTDGQVRIGRLPVTGTDALRRAAAAWPAERAAAITGVAAGEIRALAHALASTPRAVLYGRIGVCAQEFGGLAAWLCYALNALTGHLDEPGGLMFTTPAIDPVALGALSGLGRGGFARWTSRVSARPEFGGELPMAVFAEEIETPGPGQVRAVITSAGNPVLSAPGGARIERALAGLDFMVSIDPYLNETTRLAHVILPPASPLERSHYDAALLAYSVRNVARYSPPTFPRPAHARHDWEICLALWRRLGAPSRLGRAAGAIERLLGKLGPEPVLDLALRTGPHRLSLRRLRAAPHGLDLGPLERRLPRRLATADRRVQLAPAVYLADLGRLAARHAAAPPAAGLVMIGRRQLRSNNSWMHNSQRLVKGPARCTLLIHPDDAAARGLTSGRLARISTRRGEIDERSESGGRGPAGSAGGEGGLPLWIDERSESGGRGPAGSAGGEGGLPLWIDLPVEVSDEVMRGVVSVPHGWGHTRSGVQLQVATARPGQSINDILDPALVDELSGTAALFGQLVEVVAVEQAAGAVV